MLLPGGKVFVTRDMDAPDFLDKIAYAQDRRLPFGSADYTPGNDVHGQINKQEGEYPMKSHRLPAGPA